VPFCIAVEEDDTVTIRDRDTAMQRRVPIAALRDEISHAVSFARVFEKL
jgi:glycyl-tRNA synthetase